MKAVQQVRQVSQATQKYLGKFDELIRTKHCYMCNHFIKSQLPSDQGFCLKLFEYHPVNGDNTSLCKGSQFVTGGKNVNTFGRIVSSVTANKR